MIGGTGKDLLFGNKQDDTLDGGDNEDILYGGMGDDCLQGGFSDDFVSGDKGNDIITGVDPTADLPGLVEIDTLLGGIGEDTFILGDESKPYYDNGSDDIIGISDYAIIVDFDSSQDLIQLNSGDYLFSASPEGFSEGTAIFLRTSGEMN
jgi:Ca2+-binding RTX toxin-like protein